MTGYATDDKGRNRYQLPSWRSSAWVRFVLFAALALLFYITLAFKLVPTTYDIRPNAPSEKTILAPRQIENFIATEQAREEAAAKVQPVYKIMSAKNELLIETLYDKLEQNNADQEMSFDVKVSLYRNLFPSVFAEQVDRLAGSASATGQFNDTLLAEMRKQLLDQQYKLPEEAYYKLPRLTKEDIAEMEQVTKEIVSKLMNEQIIDAQSARAKVTELVNSSNLAKSTNRELVQEIARFAITPNKFADVKATDEARAAAKENTKPVVIAKGDVVVTKGEMITDELYKRLGSLDLLKDKATYRPQAGLALLSSLFVLLLFVFIRQSRLPLMTNNAQLLMLVVIFVVTMLAMRIVVLGQGLDYPQIGFLAPVAMGSVLIAILLQTQLAYIASLLFGIASSIIFNTGSDQLFDLRYGLVAFFACFAAVFALGQASQRSTILKAGIMSALAGSAAIVALALLDDHPDLHNTAFALGFALAGGLLSAVFVIGLMPFFETAFGILSPLKLVELSNPNLPLLRKLLTETPGTYHHSVMVGNLSEAAAESIGANGLLCRVGSYYHDIGKTRRPSYFIENQMNMENPHDEIEPALSKSIIVAHVREGVEMLKDAGLPKQIRDIAEQHHGSTLLKFFYHKAVKMAEEEGKEPPTEEEFRYPGPKAQSKEAAIVGIADCVEAAVRSMRNPTVAQIDSMVKSIIKNRLDDGQYNECDLTLRELDTIGKALKESLLGIFHSRIEYPGDVQPKAAEEMPGNSKSLRLKNGPEAK